MFENTQRFIKKINENYHSTQTPTLQKKGEKGEKEKRRGRGIKIGRGRSKSVLYYGICISIFLFFLNFLFFLSSSSSSSSCSSCSSSNNKNIIQSTTVNNNCQLCDCKQDDDDDDDDEKKEEVLEEEEENEEKNKKVYLRKGLRLGLGLKNETKINSLMRFYRDKYTNEFQDEIDDLQNLKNCSNGIYFECKIFNTKKMGVGSIINHIAFCFKYTFMEGYTAVFNTDRIEQYGNVKWVELFKPISNCQEYYDKNKGNDKLVNKIGSYVISNCDRKCLYKVPVNWKEKLNGIHRDPSCWVYSQFIGYLFRPSNSFKEFIEIKRKAHPVLSKKDPYFGIHYRGTDKVIFKEKRKNTIFEHMIHIDHYVDPISYYHNKYGKTYHDLPIFIAADTNDFYEDLLNAYKNEYTFIFNNIGSSIAKDYEIARYSNNSIYELMYEIQMVSLSKYFVGSMSSAISRIIYNLITFYNFDAIDMVESLDDGWYL